MITAKTAFQPNFELLRAIREKGLRQKDFAQALGESPGTISMIINGIRNADPVRKARYARTLGCRIEEIFPE